MRNRPTSMATGRTALLPLLLALLPACTETHGAKMVGSNASGGGVPERTWYVGRFAFELPRTTVGTGQTASMQDVGVEEVTWQVDSAGSPLPDPFDHLWQETLEEARSDDARRRPPSVADVIRRTLEPAPGVRLLTRHNGDYAVAARVTQALRDAGASGASFYVQYYLDEDPGLEQVAEGIVTELAETYRRHPRGTTRGAGKGAFHLLDGAIERPFIGHETVDVGFSDPLLGVGPTLKVSMRTERDREVPSAIKRWRSIALSGMLVGVSFDRIRARKRRVAGMDGEEVIYRASERGSEDEITFEWYHPGVERSPLQPMFTIELTTSAENYEAKLAYWERLLESVRPLAQETAP